MFLKKAPTPNFTDTPAPSQPLCPEEDFVDCIVEDVEVPRDISNNIYEDCILSHSTAIQLHQDNVHPDYRPGTMSIMGRSERFRRRSSDVISARPPLRANPDIPTMPHEEEPNHIDHVPVNRHSVPSISTSIYTLPMKGSVVTDTVDEEPLYSTDEELDELPRFRSRLAPCGPDTADIARSIRSGTLGGDDIEILRHSHEQDHGIPLLNELRESFPRLGHVAPGNSLFYETVYPLIKDTDVTDICCYENVGYFVGKVKDDRLQTNPVAGITVEDKEPIYSQPIKPKTKKISRDEANQFLETCNVGDYMLRRNKETTILSVKVHTKVKHIKLEFDRASVKVGRESFSSLDEMIEFYKTTCPVSVVKGIVYLRQEVLSGGLVI